MLFRIMKPIPADKSEKSGFYSVQSYYVAQSFKLLQQSGEISANDMAALEFQYLDVLDQKEYGIPNLEKQIENNPALFFHAIRIIYRRWETVEEFDWTAAERPA